MFGTDCNDKAEKTDSDTMLSNKFKNCWALFSQEGFFGMHSFWNELVQTVKVSQDVHYEKKLGNAKKLNFAYLYVSSPICSRELDDRSLAEILAQHFSNFPHSVGIHLRVPQNNEYLKDSSFIWKQ